MKKTEFYMLWFNGLWKQGQWTPDFMILMPGCCKFLWGWKPCWRYITISIRMVERGFVLFFFSYRELQLFYQPRKIGVGCFPLKPMESNFQEATWNFWGKNAYVFFLSQSLYIYLQNKSKWMNEWMNVLFSELFDIIKK